MLVKSWLLAIPQYLIVSVFVSGAIYASTNAVADGTSPVVWSAGLIGLLVTIAACSCSSARATRRRSSTS